MESRQGRGSAVWTCVSCFPSLWPVNRAGFIFIVCSTLWCFWFLSINSAQMSLDDNVNSVCTEVVMSLLYPSPWDLLVAFFCVLLKYFSSSRHSNVQCLIYSLKWPSVTFFFFFYTSRMLYRACLHFDISENGLCSAETQNDNLFRAFYNVKIWWQYLRPVDCKALSVVLWFPPQSTAPGQISEFNHSPCSASRLLLKWQWYADVRHGCFARKAHGRKIITIQ